MKKPVFITLPSISLRRENNVLLVKNKNSVIAKFPISVVDSIFVLGNVNIHTSLVKFLSINNISVFIMSSSGKVYSTISNEIISSNYRLRLNQYKAFTNKDIKLQIAKFIIEEKRKEIENVFKINLKSYKRKINLTKSIDKLLGIEGYISNLMFAKFQENLKNSEFEFKGRNYNPPKDPINVLLSFSYSIFYNLLFCKISEKGYDPYISFLHVKRGTHRAFVSDIMEVARPELTKFVMDFILSGKITIDDFTSINNRISFKKEKSKDFILEYMKFIESKNLMKSTIEFLKRMEMEFFRNFD